MIDDEVLSFDPFEGDLGAPGDKVLKNKIALARKAGECSNCTQQIERGERVRMMTARFDGQLMSYRWCSFCCAAMLKSYDDDGQAYEDRAAIAAAKEQS